MYISFIFPHRQRPTGTPPIRGGYFCAHCIRRQEVKECCRKNDILRVKKEIAGRKYFDVTICDLRGYKANVGKEVIAITMARKCECEACAILLETVS